MTKNSFSPSKQLVLALKEPQIQSYTVSFNKLGDINSELPALIAAIAGSSMNQDLYNDLAAHLTVEGSVRGRAKQAVPEEEEVSAVDASNAYPRPNGEIYYGRPWGTRVDVEVVRTAHAKKKPIFLYGPPGTGKTALGEAALPDLITVVFSGDTEVSDLIGSFVPDTHANPGASGFRWVDGPLLTAVKEGKPFLGDEIGLGDPKVLAVLYSLMDGRDEINITANPEIGVIKAAPGFYIMGATNPNAPGVRMSEALLSRFPIHAEVTTDWALAIEMGVPKKIVGIAESLARAVEDGEINWAPQFRELLAFRDLSKDFDEAFAVANLLATCPQTDRDHVAEVFSRVYGRGVLPSRI